jgi:hypothetical protein
MVGRHIAYQILGPIDLFRENVESTALSRLLCPSKMETHSLGEYKPSITLCASYKLWSMHTSLHT